MLVSKGENEERTKVFISYSRQDSAVVDRLVDSLNAKGFQTTIDRGSISLGEEWLPRLQFLVFNADVFVFIQSLGWMNSEICRAELEAARGRGKRIIGATVIPVVLIPHEHLGTDYIFLFSDSSIPGSSFEAGLERLVAGLEEDKDWWHSHTLLLNRQKSWAASGSPAHLLLSSVELGRYKTWAAARPRDAPTLPMELHDYLVASDTSILERSKRRELLIWKLSTAIFGALCVLFVAFFLYSKLPP